MVSLPGGQGENVKQPWWMFRAGMSVDEGEIWGQGGFPDSPLR